jgi:cytochrome c oxidase assembly factor CtaG
VAIWAWHMPQLYGAALEHVAIHRLQHVCFVATALLFWWSLLYGARRQRGYGVALFCLFATLLHTGALGLALGFSRHLWYPQQASQASDWGLTALEDQQLAGLVMWVPMGLIYTAAALLLASWWITWSGRTGHVAAH